MRGREAFEMPVEIPDAVWTSVYERGIPAAVADMLPARVRGEVSAVAAGLCGIEEVRLHTGRLLCGGSLYACRDTIVRGYVTYRGGYRVGVCGSAAVSGGSIVGIGDVSTLAIRIPHTSPPVGAEICRLISDMSYTRGVLIYAPPGVGKTTLVRSVAARLAAGRDARRVAVVDERGELAPGLGGVGLCVDILAGYPKARGIEIAARTLGAEVVITDEIGAREDADAVAAAQGCGVPLIATTHAGDIRELMCRPGIARLHATGAFGAYVGIRRARGRFDYIYDITPWEKADDS